MLGLGNAQVTIGAPDRAPRFAVDPSTLHVVLNRLRTATFLVGAGMSIRDQTAEGTMLCW